jgi:hypothetical protein
MRLESYAVISTVAKSPLHSSSLFWVLQPNLSRADVVRQLPRKPVQFLGQIGTNWVCRGTVGD